jgi:hypothetical protein
VIHERPITLRAPSESEAVLSPEIAPLFVVDAAIVAALRILSVHLDPSSFHPGGARHPPTRALLATMHALRRHIRQHRSLERAFADALGPRDDHHDDEAQEQPIDNFPF